METKTNTHEMIDMIEQAERFCRKIELIPGYRIKDVSAHIDWDEQMAWLRDGEDPLR